MKILNHWSAVFLLLLTLASTNVAAERGVVFDKTTGKPIPGAVVVTTWNGVVRTLVQPASQCYKVEVVTSGTNGEFDVSSLSWNLNPFLMDRLRGVTVLASGYTVSPEWDSMSLRVAMEPQNGTKSERFKRIPNFQPLGCHGSAEVMLPYLRAVYKEMGSLAESQEERLLASRILYEIESIELGDNVALRRAGIRESEIRKNSK